MKQNMQLLLMFIALGFLCIGIINVSIAKPPQAAFDACNKIAEGDQCKVQTPEGELNGICRTHTREQKFLCVPDGHKNGKRPQQKRRGDFE